MAHTRFHKRPRHGDYRLGDPCSSNDSGSSSSAFETPRNLESSAINPLLLSDPGRYEDNANLLDQNYRHFDFFSSWLMDDKGSYVIPTAPVHNTHDGFSSEGFSNHVPHYTHEHSATASAIAGVGCADPPITEQWVVVSPEVGNERPNPSSLGSSFAPPPEHLTKGGPSEQEWEERKPLVAFLYGPDKPSLNLTLQELMQVMKKAGFLTGATENMYKNRFHKWGITKNESNAPRRRRARRQPQQETRTSRGSSSSSVSNEVRVTLKDMFENMRTLCLESIRQKQASIWALDDDFCVVDDDWEDAYGSAAALIFELLEDPDSPSGWETLLDDITPMVKTLNYFSLPTILIIAYKMCKKLVNPKVRHVVGDFLTGCLDMARAESPTSSRHVPFANLLEGLNHVVQQHDDMENLADMLELIIPCYIQLVNNYGNAESATALSLLSFYHVQLGSEEEWLDSTLEKIMRLLERAEAAKGKDDKATIEIMGLAIMVLQKTKHEKTLKQLCSKMRLRISRQLNTIPRGHPDHRYFLDRMLDGYHLDIRLAQQDGEDEYAAELKKEYEMLEAEHEKEKDGYGKILELEVKELASQLKGTSL